MLQLHLKQRPQKSSPLPLAHICSKRQVSLAQGYVSICVLVLFKAVSICLFTSTLKSQESLGQYECVHECAHVCARVCWRSRPGLRGTPCGRVDRMLSAPGQGGSPGPSVDQHRFFTKTDGAVWLSSHISGLWKFLNF